MLRDKNLVPLSRQHQHALALCVRIHRASLSTAAERTAWQSEIQQHFEQEIQHHFTAEEAHLFPAARRHPDLVQLVDELLAEHSRLREYFAQAAARALDRRSLGGMGDAGVARNREEERRVFEAVGAAMRPEELHRLRAL